MKSRGAWISLAIGLLSIIILVVMVMVVKPEPAPLLGRWILIIFGIVLLAGLIWLGVVMWRRWATARATTNTSTQTRTWFGPPWQVQILVAGFTVWTAIAVFGLHTWPQWVFWLSLILLGSIYWARWDAPGVQTRTNSNLGQSIFIWSFLTAVVVVVVLTAVALFNFLFKDQEWHARVTPTMSNRVYPALNKAIGGKMFGTSQDPVNGVSGQPIRPLTIRHNDDAIEVTIRTTGEWFATGLSLYPSEAVELVVTDSLYEVTAPGWGRRTISVCGIAAGRQWYPEDLPVPGLEHRCLRATEPFGALLLRYGWDNKLPHYVGNGSRYTPSSWERQEVFLGLNLEGDSPQVTSSDQITVRLVAVPRRR